MDSAQKLYDEMPEKVVILCNPMIASYAQRGHGLRKIDLVENLHVVNDLIDMHSKSGDFDTARDLFGYNMWFHGNVIIGGYTQISHYEEAYVAIWGSLLGGCWVHRHAAFPESVDKKLFKLQPENLAPFMQELAVDAPLEKARFAPDTPEGFTHGRRVERCPCHIEKSAIAFGLISARPEITIRIVKNLRVCGNCHSSQKADLQVPQRDNDCKRQ
ncbi:hypothetical protein SLEP1_g13368 [Rubroshorea leprosula]|uniref:DYW domain-containing protein n=1 Tax=Rubroshorea leprosula TaxID=152421 RepID=A0AAV5IS24_9ROSI|nr:hypothetical protein SLEP1_g13368 [Rubroshorea leprosula]